MHVKVIMFQLLHAVAFIHSADVIHRDIKPSNILLNHDYTLKLCDFGLSRTLHDVVNPSKFVDDDTKALYGSFQQILQIGDAMQIRQAQHEVTKAFAAVRDKVN